jgi:leucyl aminopeptidase
MTDTLTDRTESAATPIFAIEAEHLADWLTAAPEAVVRYASFCGFKAKAGQVCQVPNTDGAPERVLFGLGEAGTAAAFRGLPGKLNPGDYVIDHVPPGLDAQQVATQWALGAYRYDRYKRHHGEPWPRLVVGGDVDLEEARHVAHACALARDMVNTPPNDMGPLQVETIAREIGRRPAGRELSRRPRRRPGRRRRPGAADDRDQLERPGRRHG